MIHCSFNYLLAAQITFVGLKPGISSLENHYFDHWAIVFQAFFFFFFFFLYDNLISIFPYQGNHFKKCV